MTHPATDPRCDACEQGPEPTALAPVNAPGLDRLAYRIGTHASFTDAMRRAISRHDDLDRLTTRDLSDPSIALVDAWAMVLDVLTFYQERAANEGYLRTAMERRSLLELGRELGYRLRPATSATTDLAFAVETAPGSPDQVRLDAGTKVQSEPGQDELPQVFETLEELVARGGWNAMAARRTRPQRLAGGDDSGYLAGTSVVLAPGDLVLALSAERLEEPSAGGWAMARLRAVERSEAREVTLVAWSPPLPDDIADAEDGPGAELFALRLRAALFGYNAIPWGALAVSLRIGEARPTGAPGTLPAFIPGPYAGQETSWADAPLSGSTIWLDSVYPAIQPGSWVVLEGPSSGELFRVEAVREVLHTAFALSMRVTELTLERDVNAATDDDRVALTPRNTTVFAASEPLAQAPEPIPDAIVGDTLALRDAVPTMPSGRRLVLRGLAAGIVVVEHLTPLTDAGGENVVATLDRDTVVEALAAPETRPDGTTAVAVRTADRLIGWILNASNWAWAPAPPFAAMVAEPARVREDLSPPDGPGEIRLEEPLAFAYDRTTLVVSGNVAPASHGETTREVLGGGDGSKAFQRFRLKRAPVTHHAAGTESGTESTLRMVADGIRWSETPSLHGHDADDRVFTAREDHEGHTVVSFGDGRSGARLPSGIENVAAVYRTGGGRAGRVRPDQLHLLMSRPLGLAAATNPMAAEGGTDPERHEDARRNVPRSVLTLGRIVSEQDVEDFAAAFPGIGKAQANLLWNGRKRIVHLTVAATDGAPIVPGGRLFTALTGALDEVRDIRQQLVVEPALVVAFGVVLEVLPAEDREPGPVLAAVRGAIVEAFSFEARAFAQPATRAGLLAAGQAVPGVEAVRLVSTSPAMVDDRLAALPARARNGTISPAELLVVDPSAVDIREAARAL